MFRIWHILIFLLFVSDCNGWDVDSTLNNEQDDGFKSCHVALVETHWKHEMYPHFKLYHQEFPVVQLLWKDNRFQPALDKWRSTFQEQKQTCQVIYILNAPANDEFCRIQEQFEWLVDCDMINLRSICYGRHTY